MRIRSVLVALVIVVALTGCGGSLATDMPGTPAEPAPDPTTSEPSEATYAGADVRITAEDTGFGDVIDSSCAVTVRVPDGWAVDGPIIRLGGDPIAGSFFLRGGASDGSSIEDVPSWMLDFVEWDSRDGGQFLEVDGQDAWRVTGTLTDPTQGARWSMLGDIIAGPCDLSVSASTTPDDVGTRAVLLEMFESIRLG
jgi:hypothetical protein